MGKISRRSEINRKTRETDITLVLDIDGNGSAQIDTGIPFLDHMLTLLAVHSLCDISIKAQGDIEVDDHHTVEDIGISLGQALKAALGEKEGINRYGEALLPMDEALARVVLDLSNRPYLVYEVTVPSKRLGTLSTENVKEFFQALSSHAGISLHMDMIRGENSHHIIEALFKAFGRALKMAVSYEPRVEGVWSSKGTF